MYRLRIALLVVGGGFLILGLSPPALICIIAALFIKPRIRRPLEFKLFNKESLQDPATWRYTFTVGLPAVIGSSAAGLLTITVLAQVAPQFLERHLTLEHMNWTLGEFAFYGVVIAPPLEELIFRAGLMPALAATLGTRPGILIAAIVFGIMHADVFGATLFAVMMSLLFLRMKTIVIPIILHAGNNLVVLGLIVASEESFQQRLDPQLIIEDLRDPTLVLISAIVFLGSTPWIIRMFKDNWPAGHPRDPDPHRPIPS